MGGVESGLFFGTFLPLVAHARTVQRPRGYPGEIAESRFWSCSMVSGKTYMNGLIYWFRQATVSSKQPPIFQEHRVKIASEASMQTCYCCPKAATSREHVPPKCIFPKKSPKTSIDYRSSLLTVPSCDLHNQAKSHDDEYLRTVLTTCISSNEIATQHFVSTALRGAKDRPGLIRGILSERQNVYVQNKVDTALEETLAIGVDRGRIERSLRQIVLGLYYHECEEKYNGSIDVFPFFLADLNEPNGTYNNSMLRIKLACDQVFMSLPNYGSAPDIFYYQKYFEKGVGSLLHLVFYGGVRICCLLGAKL